MPYITHIRPHISSLFLAFRLVYIPASILTHSGHGLPWLNLTGALLATFAAEALTRRGYRPDSTSTARRDLAFVVLALFLLGLFPEEAPIGVILWAAMGVAWARLWPGPTLRRESGATRAVGLIAGGLLGLTGLYGPGSWLMAGVLALWGWQKGNDQ